MRKRKIRETYLQALNGIKFLLYTLGSLAYLLRPQSQKGSQKQTKPKE
jgi:hypothetical protein